MSRCLSSSFVVVLIVACAPGPVGAASEKPLFSRHVAAVFSRLGCNAGICHGAVKGQNGFRLSLFAADPALDHDRLVKEFGGRRINLAHPEASLLLLKATGAVAHEGGKRMEAGSPEYEILRRWIAGRAVLDPPDQSRTIALQVTPAEHTARPGETYRLAVQARFADGSTEDVTALCSFDSLDHQVATVARDGVVRAVGTGDVALVVRFRAEPATALVVVPRTADTRSPAVKPHDFIDEHVLAKLRRLSIPPADLADDVTFLRRASLDVAGELPEPREIRAFLADTHPDKRVRKIDELLKRPGHAALWTLKFCDLLKASDFGVYADGLAQETDAPRFAAWVRARLEENTPYDQFVERILLATSREGRSLDEWAKEVSGLYEGYATPRTDLALYARRKTLDLYWQRRGAEGVSGAMQVAHSFLGLRLECAQCHRHPHDVWQQDDLLSFANFFMRVREPGFRGDTEKKFPEVAAYTKKLGQEAKQLTDQVKKLREAKGRQFDAEAQKARQEDNRLAREIDRLEQEAGRAKDPAKARQLREQAEQKRKLRLPLQATVAAHAKYQKEVAELDRRSKYLVEVGRRMMHAEIQHLPDSKAFATVTSPLGTQSSRQFRLLGGGKAVEVAPNQDPRALVMAWLRRPDNPYFARAIVNRVWAHYFGRGLVDPPDHLSPFNPASHPQLLQELARQFVANRYDLRWLHRTILRSRTYQQSSAANPASRADRSNYAFFYYRRLPAEVLLDALNQATGTTEDMDMKYYHWPERLRTVEVPYLPRNPFVSYMLEHFGRPQRNSAVQCDCERGTGASVLQVLSFANHPRVWQKISADTGRAARIVKEIADDRARVEEVFLWTLCRPPTETERQACLKYLRESASAVKGLQGIMWSLLNTREFLLQH